jgi:hypothetical protein
MLTRTMIIRQTQPIPSRRLGKLAPRVDGRTLKLRDYLPKVLAPVPPPEVSWITEVTDWGMLANDTLGDCVEAAQLHMIQQETRYAGTEMVPSNADAVALYSAEGGYVPGQPNTDNGTVILTALQYAQQNGVAVGNTLHKLAAYVAVDWTNAKEVQLAIWLFGGILIGIQLPLSAQVQTAWTVPDGGPFGDGSPGSWGGHCVPCFARSPETVSCITWGTRLKMSHNFFADYVDEAYALLSTDWINTNSGESPGGFDLEQLQADLAEVTA